MAPVVDLTGATRATRALGVLALCGALASCTPAPAPGASGSPGTPTLTPASPSPAASGPLTASPGASGTPTPTASRAPSGVVNRPADQLVQGGLVRLPLTALPTTWNPYVAAGQTADAAALRAPVSAPWFLLDAAGAPHPNPDFLVSAVATGSPTVVTLRINPDAVWSDGTGITAADWIATHDAFGTQRLHAQPPAGWEHVASVKRGADDREVVLTFDRAETAWQRPLLAGPARAASVQESAFATGWATFDPRFFAGPYVVAHVDAEQQLVTLEPNPRWWGSRPRLDAVMFRVVASDAVAASFAAGEFDAYAAPVADPRLPVARRAPDVADRVADSTSGRRLQFSAHGAAADPAVRLAVLQALDRAALARAVTGVLGSTPTVWNHPALLPSQAGYADLGSVTGLTHDPDAARAALQRAGWGVRSEPTPDRVLHLTITAPAADRRAAAEAAEIARQLAEVGVTVAPVPDGGDLTLADVAVSPFATADPAKDAAAWRAAATIPLYVVPETVLTRTRLANLGASGFATVNWATVGYTS